MVLDFRQKAAAPFHIHTHPEKQITVSVAAKSSFAGAGMKNELSSFLLLLRKSSQQQNAREKRQERLQISSHSLKQGLFFLSMPIS